MESNERDIIAVAAELFFAQEHEHRFYALPFTRNERGIVGHPSGALIDMPAKWRNAAANSAPYHIGGSQPPRA